MSPTLSEEYGIDYSKCPRHTESVRRYVEEGGHVGHFLEAVFADSLSEAVGRADSTNRDLLVEWVMFVYNELPSGCWGSTEKVREWQRRGGLRGMQDD